MTWQLATFVVSGALVAGSGTLVAHHSFAMFDQDHPRADAIERQGEN